MRVRIWRSMAIAVGLTANPQWRSSPTPDRRVPGPRKAAAQFDFTRHAGATCAVLPRPHRCGRGTRGPRLSGQPGTPTPGKVSTNFYSWAQNPLGLGADHERGHHPD